MKEEALRQKVADIMNAWIGAVRGDERHREILSIYNNQENLPLGYRVQNADAYCATTASAAYIKAGIEKFTGTECSVPRWITEAQKRGIWVEDDAYRPKIGDAICYDWDDSGAGDNRGGADHIGIVVMVSGDAITVTEGNINNGKVGQRCIAVNARYIRGYICPDFEAAAAAMNKEEPKKSVEELAAEVMQGVWGGGVERRERLEAAGYDYDAVQAAVKDLYYSTEDAPVLDDVEPWYSGDREWAMETGISDGTRPEDAVTRAEVWAMLHRYHERFGGAG